MEQISPPDYDGVERALSAELEKCIRQMFGFTGWDEGCDKDACRAVRRVQSLLNDLDSIRRIRSTLSATPDSGKT